MEKKVFYMNKRALIVLLAFGVWSGGSWYWYACKIKQKCDATSVDSSMVSLPKTAIDSSQIDILGVSDTLVNSDVILDSTKLEPEAVVETDTMVTLHFKSNATAFEKDEKINEYLVNLASKLEQGKVKLIEIVGHTDDLGAEDKNQKLSLLRANDVRAFLLKNKAPLGSMKVQGKGESMPIINEQTDFARNTNRRVEIIFK
jgi:phosphate transport system substrate-binding protein